MVTTTYTENIIPGRCSEVADKPKNRSMLRQPLVVALTFRITDMGNGVDRIEHFGRMPFDEAIAGADLPDSEPLPHPTPPRVLDAVVQVLGAVGINAPSYPELLVEGYSRLASSNAVDVFAWMALLV